jgi:predicted alpha/beta-hydrolase family hydrolase
MEKLEINISDKIGPVSGIWTTAVDAKACMLLAHGAGAGIHHPFMCGLADALANTKITSFRFNFPYIEQGKRRPDYPGVIHSTFLRIVEKIAPDLTIPLIIGGKSFGGRMGSQVMAKFKLPQVKGLVFYGFPLHPPGKPGIERADHLSLIEIPMLFLQGDRDALAKLDLIEGVISNLIVAQKYIYKGANHSFAFPKKMEIPKEKIYKGLAEKTWDFIDQNVVLNAS